MKYLLAHDIGTSGNKATLFTVEGEMVRSTVASYQVDYQSGGRAEQNPLDWWNAVCLSTKIITEGIDPDDILGLSFSAQMQCCLIVDEQGNVLRPAIIWADNRAKEQTEALLQKIDGTEAYNLLGHRLSPSYSLEKLMWIRDNEPENYKKTYKMLQVKDYIIYRMTGKFVTDYSDASGTNAFDLDKLAWSKEIIDAAGVSFDLFPELHGSTDVIGTLLPEAAEQLGLTTSVKVVCGGGDGPCSAVGAGCTEDDQMFLSFGTSAWIGGTTDKKFLDDEKVLMCFGHVIPGKYMPCGTMQSAGSSYAYARNQFCQAEKEKAKELGIDSWDLVNQMAESAPAGAKGLIFLPYLAGERAPRWNPDASGSFVGIRMYHTREDYIRAVLEGVAMNLELILKSYRKTMNIEKLILTGGGAKGQIVAQILSDVLNASFQSPDHVEEATSIAAAVIAGIGCGVYQDFSAIHQFLKFGAPVEPTKENQEIYQKSKKIFDDVYQALLPLYGDI